MKNKKGRDMREENDEAIWGEDGKRRQNIEKKETITKNVEF